MTNENAMKRVLQLALNGTGKVSPNPRVGALIIKNDNIIAEGWHREFGKPHAEVEAINKCGNEDLTGSTLFVNLEPCCHTGKTPPCTDLIISKGISKVVIGTKDPNPLVSGMGINQLMEAGIEVEFGILENECNWLNRFFNKHITTALPYVILKIAQSFDGGIAMLNGESKWITCEESRKRSHYLRSIVDGVLVGKKTALTDKPKLTVRDVEGRDPRRIIFDTNLSIPLEHAFYVEPGRTNTIVCCSKESALTRKAENMMLAKIQILPIELNDEGKIDITNALYMLYEKFSIGSILVEGGSGMYSSFAKAKMFDELHLFIAPKIIGKSINSFGNLNLNFLNRAIEFDIKSVDKSGTDLHIVALRKTEE